MDPKRYPNLSKVLADADPKNKKVPCAKCGKEFQPYWLKNGVCNGCRNPNAIVPAKPASGAVTYFDEGLSEIVQEWFRSHLDSYSVPEELMNEVLKSFDDRPTKEEVADHCRQAVKKRLGL